MKQPITVLVFFLLLNLISGCSTKQIFYFTKETDFKQSYQVLENNLESTLSSSIKIENQLAPNSVVFTASTQPFFSANVLASPKNAAIIQPASIKKYSSPEKQPLNVRAVKKQLFKNYIRTNLKEVAQPEQKQIHKLATISLILGLTSLFFLLLAALFPSIIGVLSSLTFLNAIGGVVTSRIALKDIRLNPDKYSGKGRARAGFITSLVTSAVLLLTAIIGIIYLVFFFCNFT